MRPRWRSDCILRMMDKIIFDALFAVTETRRELDDLDSDSVCLAALLYALEQLLQRGQLADGVKLALDIPACLGWTDKPLADTGTGYG